MGINTTIYCGFETKNGPEMTKKQLCYALKIKL